MASITSISKPLIPINVKGSLGSQILTLQDLLLVALDGEVEARAFDVKFTDLISMENNVGISTGVSTNFARKSTGKFSVINLETVAYYQPSFKFNVLKDLSLKVGTKLGIGGALTLDFKNSANSSMTITSTAGTPKKHYLSPTFVSTLVFGAEYKNIIMETELGPIFRLNVGRMSTTDSKSSESDDPIDPLASLKIKAGYRF